MSQQLPVTPYQTSGFQFQYREVPTEKETITRTEYDQNSGSFVHIEDVAEVPDEPVNGYADIDFEYVEDINFLCRLT